MISKEYLLKFAICMSFIRHVEIRDVPRILAIYAPFILTGPVSFETEVPDELSFTERVMRIAGQFPYLVWVEDDQILGYAYACTHRERLAYRWAVETSIYLDPGARGKGIGLALYNELLSELTARNFTTAYGVITLPNLASVGLHQKCGFDYLAIHKNAGWKHGLWHDVLWMEKTLNAFEENPKEPIFGNPQ